MHAIWFDKDTFFHKQDVPTYIEACEERETAYPHAGKVFKRAIMNDGHTVLEMHYAEVPMEALDRWFDAQMKSKDAMFQMPGTSRRTSSTLGYDASLQPEEDGDF